MKELVVKGEKNGKLEIALFGEIDSGNADSFYKEAIAAYEADKRDVSFDCEALSFIDSTTLGTFVKILKKVKEDGHALALKNLQPQIKKLFLICALDSVMEIR